MTLIILAGAGFGYAIVRFDEPPAPGVKRMADAEKGIAKPAQPPTPVPSPRSTPPTAPEQTAAPELTVVATVTPSAAEKVWENPSVAARKNAAPQTPARETDLIATAKSEAIPQPEAAAFSPSPRHVAVSQAVAFPTPRFTSPGVILNSTDLETLKANLQREPWKSGFAALANEGRSKLTFKMSGPFKEIKRAPNENLWPWRSDMMAIWNLSLMWYFTREDAYAQKAHDILLAWATTHKEFGGRESMLDLGDYALSFVGGADILRGTWPGWTKADTAAVNKYFNDVLMPACNPYGESQYGAANKGGLALVAMGLMAIFNEDTAKLKMVVYQVRTLAHIGLRNSNDIGMIGDSLRDQGHAHGQVHSLLILAEALWKQGIDIYSDFDNRLLANTEFFARVNSLTPTHFIPFGTTDSYYLADVDHGPKGGDIAFPIAHGAYVVRKGLMAPFAVRMGQSTPVGSNFVFIKEVDRSVATPVLPPPIPTTTSITSGFSNVEIGGAAPTGGASCSNGTWKVQGGGSEMWKANDSCHFTYKEITGNCAIIAKVESVENTNPSARAGVMMRTSLSEGAPRAWMAINSGANIEQNMPNLAVYGGTNYGNKVVARSRSSYWVKLERIDNIITGYVSPDGTNWAATDVGRIDAPVPTTIYVGMVVCSAANGTLNTSTFSNVQITGGNGGAPVVAPAAPAALLAAPGAKAVSLRWQSSFGATTSYTVKRATFSSGPYTTIVSGITTSSYTDTSVLNDTTYYYVVSAMNSAGGSPNSPEDSVTPRAPRWNVALGGTATATEGSDSAGNAFDSNSTTLWFAPRCRGVGAIQYDFGSGLAPKIKGYTITSAKHIPKRDPGDWQFQGSNDGTNWTTLDTQSGQTFPFRHYEMEYALAKPVAYRYFRLNITANNGDNDLQIADIRLLSDTPLPNARIPSLIHWKTNDATDRARAIANQKAAESNK